MNLKDWNGISNSTIWLGYFFISVDTSANSHYMAENWPVGISSFKYYPSKFIVLYINTAPTDNNHTI